MRETPISQRIAKRLSRLPRTVVVKLHGSQYSTVAVMPDLMIVRAGKVAFLETKSTHGKTRPRQDYMLELLRAAGAVVGVVRSVEEAVTALTKEGMISRKENE